MDVGRYEGVAPSMSQKGSLMLRKKMGGNQRSANFPLGFAPEHGPHQVSSFFWETQEKKNFRGTWCPKKARFPGPSKVANCKSVEDSKK